jgi:hypothetical protein
MTLPEPAASPNAARPRRWAIGGFAALLAVILIVAVFGGTRIDPEELARRCREFPVTWPDYQENVKAIDARAVAQWHGQLKAVEVAGETLLVTFELKAPWSAWNAFLPVLARTPDGTVYRNASAQHDRQLTQYRFDLGPQAQTLPWIELHYPHVERQIYLDAQGKWRSELQSRPPASP